MNLILNTTAANNATIGRLLANTTLFYTIEQPWNNNDHDTSCVPAGTYNLIPYLSPSHGTTYCLHNPALNVYGPGPFPLTGRSYCELHSANWARQLKGCIALGLEGQPMFDPTTGLVEPAVEQSKDAIDALFSIINVGVSGHTLTINRNVFQAIST